MNNITQSTSRPCTCRGRLMAINGHDPDNFYFRASTKRAQLVGSAARRSFKFDVCSSLTPWLTQLRSVHVSTQLSHAGTLTFTTWLSTLMNCIYCLLSVEKKLIHRVWSYRAYHRPTFFTTGSYQGQVYQCQLMTASILICVDHLYTLSSILAFKIILLYYIKWLRLLCPSSIVQCWMLAYR